MKVTIVNGTEIKGCTWHIKEAFLFPLRERHEITEFVLPRDMPHFCRGCKACIFQDPGFCPHAKEVRPIWLSILEADLLVFTAPVYVLGIPAGLKALLDHFVSHWMVHRPEPAMFSKHAVILTNSIGPSLLTGGAHRDIINSVSWMGISKYKRLNIGLFEGVIWEDLSKKRSDEIERAARKLGEKYLRIRPAGKSLKTRFKFTMCKIMHNAVLKKEDVPGADNQYWIDQGWLKPKAKA